MTPRELVAEAWAITTRERALWRWGFVASFFETLLNIKLLGFQAYVFYEYFFASNAAGFFDFEIWVWENLPGWASITIFATLVLLFIIEFFMPHLSEGALIGLAAKSHRGEPMKGGLVLALYNFFSIFAIHELFILSSWTTVLTACSIILRYMPGSLQIYLMGFVVGIWMITNLFKFFAGFAEPSVVLTKRGVFASIARSYKLILSNLGHIMFLLLLLLVISVRILINTLAVFLVPAIAIGIGLALTYVLSPGSAYLIGAIIGVILVFFVSYFLSYLHVFRRTVWTLTFMHLDQQRDLDVFDGMEAPAGEQSNGH